MHFFAFRKNKYLRFIEHYQRKNFLYLLISLGLLFFLWPFLVSIGIGQYVFTFLILMALFSGPHTIKQEWFFLISAPLFILIITSLKILAIFDSNLRSVVLDTYVMFGILISIFIVVIILRYILERGQTISINKVYGAVCAYVLIGISWGLLFFLVEKFNPGALYPPIDSTDMMRELSRCIYYSFVTLTSTGFGDVYSNMAVTKQLTITEMIIGQIYPIVLIGWLVENLRVSHK